jgi:Ca-activated chloride channel family protein
MRRTVCGLVRRILSGVCVVAFIFAGLAAADQGSSAKMLKVDPSSFPQVACWVDVLDAAGKPLAGLTAGDFSLSEDGSKVARFGCLPARPDKQKLALALVIDTSGSMRGDPLTQAQRAASDLVSRLGPDDYCAIVGFSSEVKTIAEMRGRDPGAMGKLRDARAGGDTALYDAVIHAAQALSDQPASRNAVIVLTDGQDNASHASRSEAVSRALECGVPVFTVGLGDADPASLQELAKATGGGCYLTSHPSELVNLYRQILERVRTYYVLTYASPRTKADKRWRTVEVALASRAGASATGHFVVPENTGQPDLWDWSELSERALPIAIGAAVILNVVLLVGIAQRRRRRR